MGIFDFFGGADSPDQVGTKVLTAYYNEASKFPGFDYASYESWLAYLLSKVPDYVTLIGELVVNNSASTTIDQAEERVVQLANESAGQASIPQIVGAAGGKGDTVNWTAGIPEITSGIALDAATLASDVAQNVGQGVIGTLKVTKYLPWILGGAAAIYIVVLAKGHSSALKRLTK